ATRAPVALVCTSGTAAANFLPAVVEASHARVPLVLLTADRPPELRDWGAPQTIDQVRLFGGAVRWYAELPTPAPELALLRHVRASGARAAAVAAGPPAGPVHLNVPLREPLEPTPVPADAPALAALADTAAARGRPAARAPRASADGAADGGEPGGAPPWTRVVRPPPEPPAALVARLAAAVRAARRGVLLAGPQDGDPA